MALTTQGQGDTVVIMGRLYVTTFCCFMSLETGANVIAYAHLALGTFLSSACGAFAVRMWQRVGTIEDVEDLVYSKMYAASLMFGCCSCTHVVLALVLIIGLNKRSARYVRTWVWLMSLLLFLGLTYMGMVGARAAHTCDSVLMLVLKITLWFVAMGYILVTMSSFCLVLRSEEDAAKDAAVRERQRVIAQQTADGHSCCQRCVAHRANVQNQMEY